MTKRSLIIGRALATMILLPLLAVAVLIALRGQVFIGSALLVAVLAVGAQILMGLNLLKQD